jgi:hypothetical protein
MFALWPPGVSTSGGGKYQLNKIQEYIWENWLRIAEGIPELDILIWNGDLIDGKQPKEGVRFIVETDVMHQARAFLEAAAAFQKRVRGTTYVTRGSRYHDVEDSATEMIAYSLGATPDEFDRCSHDWLLFEVQSLRFDVAHAQSVTLRYSTMPLEREGQFSDMSGVNSDVIIRSHSHQLLMTYTEGANRAPLRLGISTPAWQSRTSYASRRSTPNRAIRRNLGMIVIEVEPDNDIPIVRPYLFPHPPLEWVVP